MSKKGVVNWTPQQLAEYEKRRGIVAPVVAAPPMDTKLKKKRRRVMNGTESRFADVLAAMQRRGEIENFEFEGMSIRWGNEETFTYTPDFTVIVSVEIPGGTPKPHVRLCFVEVKGALIRNADWSRFKHARDNHPLFDFELWQWKEHNWTRLA